MRRGRGFVSMFAVVLLGLVSAVGLAFSAGAQDATPPAGGFEIAPGVMAEILPTSQDPPLLYRLHFAPGVTYEMMEDPSIGVVYINAGTLVLRVDVPVTVAQSGATGTAGETFTAGTEFTVTAGDYFVLPPSATGEVRNDGDETATVSVAGLVPEHLATPAA